MWWNQNEQGVSIEGETLVWGDEPADAFGDALDKIETAFMVDHGRRPTLAELKAGLLFSAVPRYVESDEVVSG